MVSESLRVVVAETAVFQLFGELDMVSAPILTDAIRSAFTGQESVTLDMSGLTFMDSEGIRVLVQVAKAMRERGGVVIVRGATGIVRRVLNLVDAGDWPGVTIEDG